ncbi:MAG: HD domain-containing protein [Patescibacteria group bacterium]
MTREIRDKLLHISGERQTKSDPSHDIHHVTRVMNLAERIAKSVHADLDVVIAAACFHDVVVYQKNSPQSKNETDESAALAETLLQSIEEYPSEKIPLVQEAIRQCSYSKGIIPDLLEAKVLQDADRLEATGAISIMRTFSSGGQMNQQFYRPEDPFCEKGEPVAHGSGLDLFYRRLLLVEQGMHTDYAKKLAKPRTSFLHSFLDELRLELKESGIIE